MYITQIHRILDCSVIVKKMHSAHVQLLSCRYPIMLYHYGPQISLENLFFLSSKFCDSQTPNDKIVGKTQGNVYFFSVNGYQTSNTNYHTLLKSPSPPFSMLIYARHKCETGLKIWGINIELGGRGDFMPLIFISRLKW